MGKHHEQIKKSTQDRSRKTTQMYTHASHKY